MSDPQIRVLVVQSGFLGDAVLAAGMVRAFAGVMPGARIGLLVRSEFAAIFEGLPGLECVHGLDKRRAGATRDVVAEVRAARYSIAFLPHRSLRSAAIAWRAGIPRRIGFRQSDFALLLTDRVEYVLTRHETDRNADLIERAGLKVPRELRAPLLIPRADAMAEVRAMLGDEGEAARPVAIAPGSVWRTKRWGADGFAEVAARLRGEGRRVLLLGSAGEAPLCADVARRAGLRERDNLAGRLTLPGLVAAIASSSRLITNDSAPLHIAESVGTPTTAIFGPTVPEFGFAPQGEGARLIQHAGLACRPCGIHGANRCPTGTHACMRAITPEQVLRGVP